MSRTHLKNFCIEPETAQCSCLRDIRCGGIIVASDNCPEHGVRPAAPALLLKTHFHPIQGRAVGTKAPKRYDAKAS